MINYSDLIGVPFEYGGRGPDLYDCYGLLMELHRRQGKIIPDYRSTSDSQVVAETMRASIENKVWIAKWLKESAADKPPFSLMQPGDVLLLKIKGLPCHVGMVVEPDKFVHTWEGVGSVLTERISLWRQRILGIYKFND